MAIEKQIAKIRSEFLDELSQANHTKSLEKIKVHYLGKKGCVQALMQELKSATKDQRPLLGKMINDLKVEISSHVENSEARLSQEEQSSRLEKEEIDISLPGRKKTMGRAHPIILMMDKMLNILIEMGFSVQLGPDLESDYYNFEALNFEKDHPARDMQDTFYITKHHLLRTHTSNTQVRVMEKNKPPLRVAVPGRCYRNETVSARSHVFFHQIELFYVDKKVSFADLLDTMDQFWAKVFNQKVKTRYRPSYFPFVEPGLEIDVSCIICSGKGCKICKHTGWLEVNGAGMIHPNVLKYGNIDPEEYSGYAVGMGPARAAMLLYGITDIRDFTENDRRFLDQFC